MDRYIVVSPHSAGDCVKVLKQVESTGYITHFDWGCKGGEHTAWAIVEADTADEALLVVPSLVRRLAKAVKIIKISPDEARSMT